MLSSSFAPAASFFGFALDWVPSLISPPINFLCPVATQLLFDVEAFFIYFEAAARGRPGFVCALDASAIVDRS